MKENSYLYSPEKIICMVIHTLLYAFVCFVCMSASNSSLLLANGVWAPVATTLLKDILFSIVLIAAFHFAYRQKRFKKAHLFFIGVGVISLNVLVSILLAHYILGSFDIDMLLPICLSVLYMIIMSGNPFVEKTMYDRVENIKQLEQEKRVLELYYLNMQLNPHFLFNTMNVMYVQARKEKAHATSEMIMTLSDLLRYQLYESADQKVMLKSEIKHVENYIELQKLRQTDLTIDYHKDGNFDGIMVYPFLTISLLENAFKYVSVNNSGEKFVKIFIGVEEKNIFFVVQNTKSDVVPGSASAKPKSSGIGIVNTRKRLDLLYTGRYELDIQDKGMYFNVELKILLEND